MRPRFRRLRRFVAFFCLGIAGLIALDDDTAPPAFLPSSAAIQALSGEESAPPSATTTEPDLPPTSPHVPPVPVAVRALSSAGRPETLWREKNRVLEALIGALTGPGEPPVAAMIELVPFGAGVGLPAAPELPKKLVEVRHKLFPAPPKLSNPRLGFTSLAQAAGED